MRIPFQEEFESTINDSIYFIECQGTREWDEEERMFTVLNKLNITDEFGNELNDNDEVYNEIQEHILHSKDFQESIEETSYEENFM